MKTYRLLLIREADGVVYGIKEFEACDDHRAQEVAADLVSDRDADLLWEGERLVKELRPYPSATA